MTILTFDYGLPRSTLLHDRPEGTARGYWKHQMITDILAQPGEQDITCHLCWDNLMESMNHHGFKNTTIQNAGILSSEPCQPKNTRNFHQQKNGDG